MVVWRWGGWAGGDGKGVKWARCRCRGFQREGGGEARLRPEEGEIRGLGMRASTVADISICGGAASCHPCVAGTPAIKVESCKFS